MAELPPDARPLDAGTPRAQSRFNAADLPVQGWYAFEFDPLPNSAGRRFVLLLESPGSTPAMSPGEFSSFSTTKPFTRPTSTRSTKTGIA